MLVIHIMNYLHFIKNEFKLSLSVITFSLISLLSSIKPSSLSVFDGRRVPFRRPLDCSSSPCFVRLSLSVGPRLFRQDEVRLKFLSGLYLEFFVLLGLAEGRRSTRGQRQHIAALFLLLKGSSVWEGLMALDAHMYELFSAVVRSRSVLSVLLRSWWCCAGGWCRVVIFLFSRISSLSSLH